MALLWIATPRPRSTGAGRRYARSSGRYDSAGGSPRLHCRAIVRVGGDRRLGLRQARPSYGVGRRSTPSSCSTIPRPFEHEPEREVDREIGQRGERIGRRGRRSGRAIASVPAASADAGSMRVEIGPCASCRRQRSRRCAGAQRRRTGRPGAGHNVERCSSPS